MEDCTNWYGYNDVVKSYKRSDAKRTDSLLGVVEYLAAASPSE